MSNSWMIKLGYYDGRYTVISVKNSTRYVPGQVLSQEIVDGLCQDKYWEVVIVKLNEAR
jgi:hypothetical protein